MPYERSNVEFPLWRKKMDGAMFDDKCTVIPIWVRKNVFQINKRFTKKNKNHIDSKVEIVIAQKNGKKSIHDASVTLSPRKTINNPVMRLYFGDDVKEWLKISFRKTYLRNEQRKKDGLNGSQIEKKYQFWEFIDIEWNEKESKFYFRSWYNIEESEERITKKKITNQKAWMVLQKPDSIYEDLESECYEYPRSIPNGRRISVGDYLICTLTKKDAKNGKRIIGIGKIIRIDEYLKNEKTMRKAFYEWYKSFPNAKSFDFIQGDPRNNRNNAINLIQSNRTEEILSLLFEELQIDNLMTEKEFTDSGDLYRENDEDKVDQWLIKTISGLDE